MRLDLQTDEGRALAVLLTMLGALGRGVLRTALLDRVTEELTDAKHTLDVMNEFERAFDEIARAREVAE